MLYLAWCQSRRGDFSYMKSSPCRRWGSLELSREALVHPCVVHTATQPHTQRTQKLICVFSAPLTDKDTHAHKKTALNTCTWKQRRKKRLGWGMSGVRKGKRARERAVGERVRDKESERRARQTKEKSVTHREQGEQGKKELKKNPENQQKKKKKKRAEGRRRKKPCLQSWSGRSEKEQQQRRGRTEKKKGKRDMERKGEGDSRGGGGECQG